MERALASSEALTAQLFADKERIMMVLKRDAPKIFRQFQLDIFTELCIYKSRVKTQLNIKLNQTNKSMIRKAKCDKKEGTEVSNVKDHQFCYFKRDEFKKLIQLETLPQCEAEVQTFQSGGLE